MITKVEGTFRHGHIEFKDLPMNIQEENAGHCHIHLRSLCRSRLSGNRCRKGSTIEGVIVRIRRLEVTGDGALQRL